MRTSSIVKSFSIIPISLVLLAYLYLNPPNQIISNPFQRHSTSTVDFQSNDTADQGWTRTIWQTSKLVESALGEEDKQHVKTWTDKNPGYRHELMTDERMDNYAREKFHVKHPDIEDMYFQISDIVLRSDFIRYLIMLADGGVYNDLDVGCEKPIDTWVPQQFSDRAGILLGVEVDNKLGPDGRTFAGGDDLFELVNWTIMAKKGQPFMWFLVNRVMENLKKRADEQKTSVSELQYSIHDILITTGPGALTAAFFDYATEITGFASNYKNFTKMTEPILVGEVVILPINSFGAGHQVEWAGFKQDGTALIHHYFAGSWKESHVGVRPTSSGNEDEQRINAAQEAEVKAAAEAKSLDEAG